jgi:ABC-type spermidine/putrescine transport system permease subunit II
MFSRAYKTAVTAPPLLWVGIFLLLPYLLMFCYSFWSVSAFQTIVHTWSFDNYARLLRVDVYRQTLFRSMWIAARVTMFSLLLGYPLAYFLSFYAGKKKDLLYQLVIIPLWVSYLVRAYAWKTILGSDGVLNALLQYGHITKHPLEFLLYSPFAVVLTLTHIYTPFAFGAHSPQAGRGIARSWGDTFPNFLESDFSAVDSGSCGGSNVRLRAQPWRFSCAAAAWRPERHHDLEHRGQPVWCGL